MSIYSVNILSVWLSVMLQKALLLMDVFILVLKYKYVVESLKKCSSKKTIFLTCTSCFATARDGFHVEGKGLGGTLADTLLKQTFPPAFGDHPVGGGGGCDCQDHRDHTTCEGDNLKTKSHYFKFMYLEKIPE